MFVSIIFLVWSIILFRKLSSIFEKERKYFKKNPIGTIPKKFLCQVRIDFEKWNFWKFYLLGLFLIPLRFSLLFVVNIVGSGVFYAAGKIYSSDKNTSAKNWENFKKAANVVGSL